MPTIKRHLFTIIGVTLAAPVLMLSACKDHNSSHSSHDAPHGHGAEKPPTAPAALAPAEGAQVKILSPSANQIFRGDQVPIQFELVKGKKGHHVHAYVDGELAGMFTSTKGTLSGIKPGNHTLEVRVVMDDHKTEIDATDRVRFTVNK